MTKGKCPTTGIGNKFPYTVMVTEMTSSSELPTRIIARSLHM
jgi:hypothetical protein